MRRERITLLGGLSLIIMSMLFIWGWIMHPLDLIAIFPRSAPMQFNASLMFILIGLGIIFFKYRKFSSFLGLILIVFSALTLGEYVFSYDLGIDIFFYQACVNKVIVRPERPALNTCFCLILMGIVLFLRRFEANLILATLSIFLLALAVAIGLVAVTSYIFAVSDSHAWGAWTRMALPSALGIILSGLLLLYIIKLLSAPITVDNLKYFPVEILCFLMLYFLLLWQALIKYENYKIEIFLRENFDQHKALISEVFHNYRKPLQGMRRRLTYLPNYISLWREDAYTYIQNKKGILGIGLISFHNRKIQAIVTDNHVSKQQLKKDIFSCLENDSMHDEIFYLKNTKKVCIVYGVKIRNSNGFLVAIADLHSFISELQKIFLMNRYGVEILANNKSLFLLDNHSPELKQVWGIRSFIEIYGYKLDLIVWPDLQVIQSIESNAPLYIFLMGTFFSILLFFLIANIIKANRNKNHAIQSEKRLFHILDATPDALIMIDKQGVIRFANNYSEKIFGFRIEELIGFSVEKLLPERYRQQHKQHREHYFIAPYHRLMGQGKELFGQRKNGQEFPVVISLNPVEKGDSQLTLAAIRDVTDQKAQEADIINLNQHLQAILNSSHLSIIATDLNGVITLFNHAAELVLEYSASEMIGKRTPEVFHDPVEIKRRANVLTKELGKEITPDFATFVAKLDDNIEADENEWTYVSKSGKRTQVLLSVTALRNRSKGICGYLGIALNISERKEVEKIKNEFISVVSHELRTPLTSIHGAIALLSEQVLGAQSPESLELINIALNNAERLGRLINDILDLEKIEAGKMDFCLKEYSLNNLIQEAILCNNAYADKFFVSISNQASIPENVFVKIDHDRMIQVLTNLLSNAIKFSFANGTVFVNVIVSGDLARIEVTDQGKGIAVDFQNVIFNKFAQADSSAVRMQQGTGLGLHISKIIIENMGGTIGYRTQENVGTTFYIDIPIAVKESLKILPT
jgi:PAS domain S-box-containing protein